MIKFKLLKIVKKYIIKTWKMFFIIKKCGHFVKRKNNLYLLEKVLFQRFK